MTRVPVPDDYERGHVSVAGEKDFHFGQADVNVEAVDRARDVSVQEDEDGRYLGVNANYADEVAAFLGVDLPEDDGDDLGVPEFRENVEASTVEDTEWVRDAITECDDAELLRNARGLTAEGSDLCQFINEKLADMGLCPWCDDYEGDGVPQHASSAHPDEWDEYTED